MEEVNALLKQSEEEKWIHLILEASPGLEWLKQGGRGCSDQLPSAVSEPCRGTGSDVICLGGLCSMRKQQN